MPQSASNRDDNVRVASLHVGQNCFLVVAEEEDFPRTEPGHWGSWVDDYSWYYYFGRLVYMDPFDKRFFDS